MTNKNAKNNNVFNILKSFKKRLVFAFLFLVIIGIFVSLIIPKENIIKTTARKLFSGNNPVSSVEIKTDDYDNEGSIKLTKEAHWISKTEAELDLKLETIRKTGDNKKDIILVFDVSGSMEGEKLEKVKEDASELINYVLDKDEDNKVGLITFASESRIISSLTNNKEELFEIINSISTEDSTNYYLAYKSIEEILVDYNKETGKDLVVLFMTDGSPTENAGATKGVYESLKEQHPYMTLNAVEYEKGKSTSDTQDISDGQWVADMNTLNNILFEATVSPEAYEKIKVIDYIDNEYFDIETNTPSKGNVVIDNNKITWRFGNNSYITGSEETLKVRLKLKDEYAGIKGLYSTNKKTEIEYKIDNEKEKASTLTPILKNNYDVIYDINTPENCTLENPEGENHFIYDTVTIKNIEPKCTGYQLKGWQIEERDVKYKSEDKFIMPEHDVHVKAIWARQTMKAYMDGTVHEKTTLYKTIESDDLKTGAAKLYTGEHQDSLTIPGTENIYYYKGNVTTNNVIFANFCWQIVRTTDTGGIKLIYNGIPTNNTCYSYTIGIKTGSYNGDRNSPALVGYKYNKKYNYSTINNNIQTQVLGRTTINKEYYFSQSYEYNQSVSNRYVLYDNLETEEDERFTSEECLRTGNCNDILTGTYTFSSSNKDYNNKTIRYVVGVSGEYVYYITLSNGQDVNDVNQNFYVGDNYVDNQDGTFTITASNGSTEKFKKEKWLEKYTDVNNKYICYGSNPCSNPNYIITVSNYTYNSESVSNNYTYANDFDYILNEETGKYEYLLKDTNISNKMQFWDWHNKYSQINNNHYTCFNQSGKCEDIKYIYYTNNSTVYYITIKDGKDINDALNEMLNANDVNTTDSIIKASVDGWYESNMIPYGKFLEDVIFCNDRRIISLGGWNPNGGKTNTYLQFNSYSLNTKLDCGYTTDKFSLSNEQAQLLYPVGLLTGNEAQLTYINRNSFLFSNFTWLISPYSYNNGDGRNGARMTVVYAGGVGSGNYYGDPPDNRGNIRPVVSLKPGIEYTDGDGTVNNPYIIDTTE